MTERHRERHIDRERQTGREKEIGRETDRQTYTLIFCKRGESHKMGMVCLTANVIFD